MATMPSVGSGTYSPGPNMVCSPQQEKVGTGSIEASTCPVYIDLRIRATVSKFLPSMSRHTSTMTISLPEDLKQFVKKRSLTTHYGTPSDYIRGLIREDLKRLEQELLKGLRSGKGIPMTKDAWKQLRTEAAKRIRAKSSS